MARKTQPNEIYQIKVTLKDTHPPIWRRLLVPSDVKLSQLHDIIQIAMGWTDSHLHQFIVGGDYYGNCEYDDWGEMKDERKITLKQAAPGEKAKLRYEYDFGDSWEHDILVEKVLPPDPQQTYPVCIKGARACPPEDVGGVWGYQEFLEAIGDPNHPEHEEYLEWVGEEFDPEAFDMDGINEELKRMR